MSHSREVRMTLIGKTGVGKSSAGNTILGQNRFSTGSGSSSVTRRYQKEIVVIADRTVTVVDTPDYFHLTHEEEDLHSEIERSVMLSSPGVHAFLYVLKPSTFTKQEAETVSKFKQTYGEEVVRHTIVLFTHGDQLQRVDMNRLISQNQALRSLVSQCGGRFTVINNEAPADRDQVYYLLDIIDRMMSETENSFYTLEMLQEAQRRAEEQREMSQEERARIKHQEELKRVERETEERVRREMEEERARAAAEEAQKFSTEEEPKFSTEEESGMEKFFNQLHKVKYWFVHQQKYVYITAVFSLTMGCLLNTSSADRWTFLHGCGLGGSAAVLGVIIGKFWVLMGKSQFRMACSSAQQRPNASQYISRALGVLCGGVAGAGVGLIASGQTPVTLLAALAGAAGAFTAMHRIR